MQTLQIDFDSLFTESLDSDLTHKHFLMYLLVVSVGVILYYIYPWVKLFFDHYFIYNRREKIIILGQSRTARSFANDAAEKGKKVILISSKRDNNFSDELKLNGVKLVLVKDINEKRLRLAGINHSAACFVASDKDEFNISMANKIGQYKKNKGGRKLKLVVSVSNWDTRNLLIDQVNSFNSTPYVSVRFFDINTSAAQLIYDKYSPTRFVDDSTIKNYRKAICIIGYNDISQHFLIENCILSQFPDNEKIKILLVCKDAEYQLEEFKKKFPALIDFISVHPVELPNSSFSTNYAWDKKFIDNIPTVDAVYVFGNEDAIVVSEAINFRQFLYTHTHNIRKVPIVANLPENTSISSLLEQESHRGQSLFIKYKEELNIQFIRMYHDTCTYSNIIDDNEIEALAKVTNYYYSLKHGFDNLLNEHFKKTNNSRFLKEIEQRLIIFKIKKHDPYKQIQALVIEELQRYTKNSEFRLTQIFGIEQIWESVSERNKEANRYVVRHLPSKQLLLEKLGIKEINESSIKPYMDKLAPLEHNRWSAEKITAGFNFGELPENDKKTKAILKNTLKIHNQLKRYNLLDSVNKEKDMDIYLIMPLLVKVKENL